MISETHTLVHKIEKVLDNTLSIQFPKNKSYQEYLAYLGFILYFAKDINKAVFVRLFSLAGLTNSISVLISSLIPLFLTIPYAIKQINKVKKFLVVYVIVLIYFLTSILLNLKYLEVYLESRYGVFQVFRPDGGIWAIFFILLIFKEPILDFCFKTFSILMFVMHLLQFLMSRIRGGFIIESFKGELYHSPYSLTFGVSVAFACLFFINFFLKTKKIAYLFFSIISYVLIIIGGNRASLGIPVFFLIIRFLYDNFIKCKTKKDYFHLFKKLFLIILITVIIFILLFLLLRFLSNNYNISFLKSRNIQMILKGELFSDVDNARNHIHSLVVEGAKKHPILGLGAYGDRPLVTPHYVWGHSHGIIYEIWSNLGLLLGIPFVIFLLYSLFFMFTRKKSIYTEYYFIFYAASIIHHTSLSFWLEPFIWSYLTFFILNKIKSNKNRKTKIIRFFHQIILFFINSPMKRAEFLSKHRYFNKIGNRVMIMPRKIPLYSELISIGNNVWIASNVTFVTHDVIHYMLNGYDKVKDHLEKLGCISIGDNVFIGSNSTIVYDVKIGNNVIIAAGSVITKDLNSNGVYAGVPVKKIMDFDSFYSKRIQYEDKLNLIYEQHNLEKHISGVLRKDEAKLLNQINKKLY